MKDLKVYPIEKIKQLGIEKGDSIWVTPTSYMDDKKLTFKNPFVFREFKDNDIVVYVSKLRNGVPDYSIDIISNPQHSNEIDGVQIQEKAYLSNETMSVIDGWFHAALNE
jgi:hypothetical protein